MKTQKKNQRRNYNKIKQNIAAIISYHNKLIILFDYYKTRHIHDNIECE